MKIVAKMKSQRVLLSAIAVGSSIYLTACNSKFNYAKIKTQPASVCASESQLIDPRSSGPQPACSSSTTPPSSTSTRPSKKFNRMPAIANGTPNGFVTLQLEMADSPLYLSQQPEAWKNWILNLTSGAKYYIKATRLTVTGSETIYDANSDELKIPVDLKADSYLIISVTDPSGNLFRGVLVPAFGDKDATLTFDRTSTVAANILERAHQNMIRGDEGAEKAVEKFLISVEHLHTLAYAALLVIDEKESRSMSTSDPSLGDLGLGVLRKTIDAFAEMKISENQYSYRISESAYENFYKARPKTPTAIPGFRSPQLASVDVGMSVAATDQILSKAYEVSANILRTTTPDGALIAVNRIPALFHDLFAKCLEGDCAPGVIEQAPSLETVSYFTKSTGDMLGGNSNGSTGNSSDSGNSSSGSINGAEIVNTGVILTASPISNSITTATFTGGANLQLPPSKTLALAACDFTIETWANLRVPPKFPKVATLIDNTASTSATAGTFKLYINSDLSVGFERKLLSGGTWKTSSGPDVIKLKTWQQVSLVRDGSAIKILINGDVKHSQDMPISVQEEPLAKTSLPWAIGANPDDPLNTGYNGDMEGLQVRSCPVKTLAKVTFSPQSGAFGPQQDVKIFGPKGANIYYTVNGTAPSEGSNQVQLDQNGDPVAIQVNKSLTMNVVAKRTGWLDSPITSAEYIINGKISAPMATPAPGFYENGTMVSLISAVEDATIEYRINTSNNLCIDNFEWTKYTGPITVNSEQTICARSKHPSYLDSSTIGYSYEVPGVVASPIFSPERGPFYKPTQVRISSATPNSFIYYTTDGSAPTESNSKIASGGIVTFSPGMPALRAIAMRSRWTNSAEAQVTGTVMPPVPNINPGYQTVSPIDVNISTPTIGAIIHYSFDKFHWNILQGPLTISSDQIVYAKASMEGYEDSEIVSFDYYFPARAPKPSFDPSGNSFSNDPHVSITSKFKDVLFDIYCTTDGSAPTVEPANLCNDGVKINRSSTLRAVAAKDLWQISEETTSNYQLNVNQIQFQHNGISISGNYDLNNTSTIKIGPVSPSESTNGSVIYYTLDGTTPTADSLHYNGGIEVSSDTVVRAISIKDGYSPSPEISINLKMKIADLGFYRDGIAVNSDTIYLSNEANILIAPIDRNRRLTTGMKIYYTLDGNTPTVNSALYQEGGIQIKKETTVRAIGVMDNYQSPPEIRATFKLTASKPTFIGQTIFNNIPAEIKINSETENGIIRYTLDGKEPDANSSVYSGQIRLTSPTTTITAKVFRDNFVPSEAVSKTFHIKVGELAFDPEPGPDKSFPDAIAIKVSTMTENPVTLYYTTDGTTPTINSSVYENSIKLTTSSTVRVLATREGFEPTESSTRPAYILKAGKPIFDPKPNNEDGKDFYGQPQKVTITSATQGAKIYYTTNGENPDPRKHPLYVTPIAVTDTSKIRAIAVKDGFNPSDTSEGYYRLIIKTCTEPVYACLVGEWICGAMKTSSPRSKAACEKIGFEYDANAPIGSECGAAQCASSCQEYYGLLRVRETYVTPMILASECPTSIVSQASSIKSASACEDLQLANPELSINWDVLIGSSCTETSGGKTITTPGIQSRAVFDPTPLVAPKPSVPSGTYTAEQVVTLDSQFLSTTALSNKAVSSTKTSIYYTTDGSPPTTKSNLYTAPITVSSTTTIKAIAVKVGAPSPQTMTAAYTITGTVPQPKFSMASGSYGPAQSVAIQTDKPGDSIYYTTDGSLPSRLSSVYSTPISVARSVTIKAIAVRSGWADSAVASVEYVINGKASAPLFSVAPGAYGPGQMVSLSTSTFGAIIRYTVDGSTPTVSSTIYLDPITVANSQTIKAITTRANFLDSDVSIGDYVINGSVVPPMANVPPGTYPSARSVELTTATPGAKIHYTLDGSQPLPSSAVYSGPVFIGVSQTIKAIAVKEGFSDSSLSNFKYTITGSVAAPSISPPGGAFGPAQSVTLETGTPDAAIYYTTDGSTPTSSSSQYSGPISVNGAMVIKAIAILQSWTPSQVVSAEFTINGRADGPTFSVASGTYGPAQVVSITSPISGATIHYTQDGSEPSASSPIYTTPLNVFESKTIKAIATKAGYSDSFVTSAAYTINGPAGNPAASAPSGLYTSAPIVSLSSSTPGAAIFYTLDGTDPTAASTKYSGPFTISETSKLKMFANTPVHSDSAIMEYNYKITGTVQRPTFSVTGGAYASTQTLTLTTSPSDAQIYYTLNGADATSKSTAYTGPIVISASQTVSAIAVKTDWADSPQGSQSYIINGQVAAPTLSVASGSYGPAQIVSIQTTTPGATIFYTLDGKAPTIASTIYSGPISVTASQTIKAFAVKAIYQDSPVVVGDYVINGPVAKPTASPNGGNFYTAQSVTLESSTPDAKIYFTTDGSIPSAGSDLYTGPIFVGVSQTLKAIAVKPAFINSEVLSIDFNIYGTAQNPTFSVAPGSYGSPQMVGLSSATPGATIYYTVDGSTPTNSSTVYSSPISVSSLSSVTTIKAFAVKTNWADSAIVTGNYTINGAVDTPRFSLPSGGYGPTQTLTITSSTPGATIYYTLDGVAPTTSSARYSGPITVSTSTTIKALASKQYYADSQIGSASYSINGATEPPTSSLTDGTYYGTQAIMLMTPTTGGSIYYTLDGSNPSTNSNYFWSPIILTGPATIKAITAKDGFSDSTVSTFTYTVYGPLPAPTFSLAPGGYGPAQTVAISSSTAGSVVRYTTDGSNPTASSAIYTDPIAVTSSMTLKAIATKSPYPDSTIASATYTINGSAAAPVASPTSGSFATAQAVSLSSATDGTTIYYTLDGSNPTTSSPRYSGPIFVAVSQTIKAMAVKSGYINSAIMSADYKINGNVQTPIFSVASGTYGPAQTVTIYSATPGASIYYTTDGLNPTSASNAYGGPIQVTSTMTLKAIAKLTDWTDSSVASVSYTINGPVSAPVFSVPGGGYADGQTVSISTTTPGAVIRYTVDGTNPWSNSPIYSGPISVPATATIKAYATKQDYVDSAVSSASYVISTGSMITVNFSNNQTVVQPKTGGTVTTAAVNSMSGIVALVGSNPIARLTLAGTGTFTMDATAPGGLTDVVVGSGSTLSAAGYSSGDGQAPNLGNGHLVLNILGSLTVNSGGKISMDSLGYTPNRSYDGVNLGGAGKNGACKAGGAGGYGTSGMPGASGGGSVFGAYDFWIKLYLGSGGGSGAECGYDNYSFTGGRGGGAISISAANIYNSGTISAKGQDGPGNAGAGSGGTVYLYSTGIFSNTGTITAAGGGGSVPGGSGRVRLVYASLGSLTGSIVGLFSDDGLQFLQVNASLNGTSSITQLINGVGATAYTGPLTSVSSIRGIVGSQNPALAFTGTGPFIFDSTYDFLRNNLSVANGQNVTVNAALTNINDLSVNAGGTLNLNNDVGTLRNLNVWGTIYGPAYSANAGDGKAPTFGNGHLILNATSSVNLYSTGKVLMDARGYTANRSYAGLNLGGAGRTSGCSGTSASYGSLGTNGSGVFGASDFVTNLYLGSGGGDAVGCSGYDGPYNEVGSAGGGAIFISARDLSSAGTISANGGNGTNGSAGYGSGGTIYLKSLASFSNSGVISADGGAYQYNGTIRGGAGRIKISYGALVASSGTIRGMIASEDAAITSVSVSLNSISTIHQSAYGTTALAYVGKLHTISSLQAAIGSLTPVLNFSGPGTFTFDAPFNKSNWDLSVGNAQTVNVNATIGSVRNMDVGAGGTLNLNSDPGTLGNLNVSGTLTGPAYSTGTAQSPVFGNGRLLLNLNGSLTVTSTGKINMDGKGYTQNRSHAGLNLGGAGRTSGCSGGGGSYGTSGAGGALAGAIYGAEDFATNLYLGSGGGEARCDGYDGPYTVAGANGGGVVAINATTIDNKGAITAKGAGKNSWEESGAGSGGTVYLVGSKAFSNTGTISVDGGSGRNKGGQGRLKFGYDLMPTLSGTIVGVQPPTPVDRPIFSQDSGTYGPSVVVGLFSTTAGANFYYTLDGTAPTSSSTMYTGPIVLTSSATLKAIATKSGLSNSDISVANYVIDGPLSPPVASPAAGTYATAQAVSLTTLSSGAKIYYTVDGSTPTIASTLYTGQIFVAVDQVIKATSIKANYANSSLLTASYTMTGTVRPPVFSVPAGEYGPAQSITMTSDTPGAVIYYTTDGSNPTRTSAVYSGPISVNNSQTIKAFATLTSWNDSVVTSAAYTINGVIPTPTFSLASGIYPGAQSVAIISSVPGVSIYYTTDGSTPTTTSTLYSGPISVSSSVTVQALASKTNFITSAVASTSYTISNGVSVAINFTTNQTVITPVSGAPSTSTAATSMSALNTLVGANLISDFTLSGTGTFTWDVAPTNGVTNVTVNSGVTLTGQPMQSGDGLSPTLGNGHLIIDIRGLLTISSGGIISMDGRGYGYGLTAAPKQGASTTGAGAVIFNKANGGGGGSVQWGQGSGASYGTLGAGTYAGVLYGASDYWTKLYLGSQGGSGWDCGGYDCFYTIGGAGGGAIKISAAMINNSGKISANGAAGGGGGSGGTIYIYTPGTFQNQSTGNITADGGGSGGKGRIRIEASRTLASNGTISPAPALGPWLASLAGQNKVTSIILDPSGSSAVINGSTFKIGMAGNQSGIGDYLDGISSIGIDSLTVQGGAVITASTPLDTYPSTIILNNGSLTLPTTANFVPGSVIMTNNSKFVTTGPGGFGSVKITAGSTLTTTATQFGDVSVYGSGSALTVNSSATFGNVVADAGAVLNLNGSMLFASLNVGQNGTTTVTAAGYQSAGTATSWAVSPSAGNGQLILEVTGTLTVGQFGSVNMDGKGYGYGLTTAPKQGASVLGIGSASFSAPNGGGGASIQNNNGGGGSYGTYGNGNGYGNLYGASDFWTKLYLGSQGGSGWDCGGYDCFYTAGGAGGGAVKITAGTLDNSGKISANGAAGGAGGSGGTIYLVAKTNLSNKNTGNILANGATYGGKGRIRIESASVAQSDGVISPAAALAPFIQSVTNGSAATSLTLDPVKSTLVFNGSTYVIGAMDKASGVNENFNTLDGFSIGTVIVQNGVPMTGGSTFNNVSILSGSTLNTSASRLGNLIVQGASSTLTLNGSAAVGNVTVDYGGLLNLVGSHSMASLTIGQNGSSTVTTNAFSGSGNALGWTTSPGPGNGQLFLNVSGTINNGPYGVITMDAKGYGNGLSSTPKQGASPLGTGTAIYNMPNGGGGGITQNNMGSGGSYGTSGTGSSPGSTYGASDFWTNLYLGSQGGSGWQCGYDCFYTVGGAGGGAVYMTANTLLNFGRISVDGKAADTGGSGGTIVINTANFSNGSTGTIYSRGGSGSAAGGLGRIGIGYTGSYSNTGTITPAPVSIPTGTPGIATNLKATAGDQQILVTWSAPLNNGVASVTDYIVQYSIDYGSSWVTYNDGQSTANNTTIDGLENRKSYVIRIAALNSGISGPYSSYVSAFPRASSTTAGVLDGSSPTKAAPSAAYIKSILPDAQDGVYWIDLQNSGPTQVYCLMNSAADGGGWMLAMKATRGTTFSYSSSYWTQANTLNPTGLDRSDGDAKFAVMNEYAASDVMALWPDLGSGGDIPGIYSSWVWLEKNVLGGNALTTFFANTSQTQLSRTRGTQWANKFSSQSGFQFYGFNYVSGNGWAGADVRVRWGFGWNNETDQNTNDVSGGIGMGKNNYSAGDAISCCQDVTGFNRSARVEIYVK